MKGYEAFVAEANAIITTLTVADVAARMSDTGTLFVDVRGEDELWRTGILSGAVNVPRGILELAIDPASPYHNPIFSAGKSFVFYCASGIRSALATARAQEMGLERVAHLGGGLKAWMAAGYMLIPYRKQWTLEAVSNDSLTKEDAP